MSLQFSDTDQKKGIIQEFEAECGFNYGDVSGNTDLLKRVTVGVNLAQDDFWAIAIPASGKWQIDDSNHEDGPFIYTNLVSGQRNYSFTTDEQGNLILDFYKVFILPSASSTLYQEISRIDQQTDSTDINSESSTTGVPTRYDQTGNALYLDTPSSYNATRGLKIQINREASRFSYTDTVKKPGVPGIFHRYFVLRPAKDYARRNMSNDAYTKISNELTAMEAAIKYHFAGRERGVRRGMKANTESNK